MKKLILFSAIFFLLSINCFAQAPELVNYQGVTRDGSGNVLVNQSVGLQITLHSGSGNGPVVYQETHTVSTNQFGLFNIQIGAGAVQSGTFSVINWGNNTFFIEISLDVSGGTNYQSLGVQQLISVPYALYAKNSGTPGPTGPVGEIGPTGPPGNNGEVGPIGPSGPTGLQGIQGITGVTGPVGLQGNMGPTGPQGSEGLLGPTGPTGSIGVQGLVGATGPTGPTQLSLCDTSIFVIFPQFAIQEGSNPTMSWFDAAKFCGDMGARLCSVDEWYYACQSSIPMQNMVGDWEWTRTGGFVSGSFQLIGFSSCKSQSARSADDVNSYPFRCCCE